MEAADPGPSEPGPGGRGIEQRTNDRQEPTTPETHPILSRQTHIDAQLYHYVDLGDAAQLDHR